MALLSLHTIREGHHYSRRSWRGEDHRGVADHCKVNKRSMDRVVAILGEDKVKEALEVAKHLEQSNAKQKIKKRRIDRDGR